MNSAVYTLVHRSLYTIRVFYLHISVPVPSIVNIGHTVQVTLVPVEHSHSTTAWGGCNESYGCSTMIARKDDVLMTRTLV